MNRISALIRPSLVLGVALTLLGCGQAPQAVAPVDQATGGFRVMTGYTPPPCPDPNDIVNFGNIKAVNGSGLWGGDVLNFGNIAAVNSGNPGGDITNFGNIDIVNTK